MGRRKIEIKPIADGRARRATLKKRTDGIRKKAHELSVLTQQNVYLFIEDPSTGLFTGYLSQEDTEFIPDYKKFIDSDRKKQQSATISAPSRESSAASQPDPIHLNTATSIIPLSNQWPSQNLNLGYAHPTNQSHSQAVENFCFDKMPLSTSSQGLLFSEEWLDQGSGWTCDADMPILSWDLFSDTTTANPGPEAMQEKSDLMKMLSGGDFCSMPQLIL